ncbi:hypothetical protein IQ277_09350 [Nostocales cyanobacterium LEGE 12452]|nr:hypothetical protein [Nostocales cyanobacterium LEGE 12452]
MPLKSNAPKPLSFCGRCSAIARYHRIGLQKIYTFDKLCYECDRSTLDIINSKIFI